MNQRKFYAGIGSRQTPFEVLAFMRQAAIVLGEAGYILRSGGASGADKAFEYGAMFRRKEIFTAADSSEAAENIASKIHPAWSKCSSYSKKLHGRNVMQILGKTLVGDPVEFVVCWTPNGVDTGGTRTAIVLARQLNIPVYNLAITKEYLAFKELLSSFKKSF